MKMKELFDRGEFVVSAEVATAKRDPRGRTGRRSENLSERCSCS